MRVRHRWEDIIKMDLQEVGCGVWIALSWLGIGQVVGTFKCGNDPSCSMKWGEFLDWLKNNS